MTQSGKVPFVDLVSMHKNLEGELLEVCKRVIETAGFIGGPEVEGLEKEFAAFSGTEHCVAVNSGTDALRFALIAAGVKAGDAVITVPNTFIATTEAISQAGARPDFVDVDPGTYNMDPKELRRYLETKCKFDAAKGHYVHAASGAPVTAVVPVHLFGQMADMDAIMEIAEQYKLTVVEDACQAHGAQYFSKKKNAWVTAGSVGRAAAFSFYPGKNLGALGEGGAITTNDGDLAKYCVMLRDHGSAKKYFHDIEGYNGRLDSIQAGMLRVKLKHLARWNEQRREAARIYDEMLASLRGAGVTLPEEADHSKSVYHLYVIRTTQRDELQKRLNEAGVATGIHYPVPVHLQRAYAGMGWKRGDFPVAETAAAQILSLPMFAGLTREQQEQVRDAVAEAVTAETAK
jgi:dTDP-4-amino-4,6-dideoxygalactose transaminase